MKTSAKFLNFFLSVAESWARMSHPLRSEFPRSGGEVIVAERHIDDRAVCINGSW